MAERHETAVHANPLRRRLRRLFPGERMEEAMAFLETFHREQGKPAAELRQRSGEVRRELRRHGHYEHTADELAFGARLAWRNSARCIGRHVWRSLEVFDCRTVVEPDAIAERLLQHMAFANAGTAIRPAISVFAPVRGVELPAYVESRQLTQYAGYVEAGGGVLGDPLTVEATRTAMALGWQPPPRPGRFDLLPILIRDANDRRRAYPLPEAAVRRVRIEHPGEPAIAALGLEWYAVPFVSSMILTVGGIDYPCAPFHGFYMGTEIASRNFADERRYDLLPAVADALRLDRASKLWRDRALTELNEAVLYSYRRDRVTMVDHHTASEQFLQFRQAEAAAGRLVSADWSWTVPPQASAACAVFHTPMQDRHAVPNFYHSRAMDGGELGPRYDEVGLSRWRSRWLRLRRRYFQWRRRHWA